MSGRCSRRGNDGIGWGLTMFILGVLALPFVGLWLMLRDSSSDGDKVLGGILFIVGIVIWIAAYA